MQTRIAKLGRMKWVCNRPLTLLMAGWIAATPHFLPAQTPPPEALVSSLETTQLREFEDQDEKVQALIQAALEMTQLELTYQYGSADPKAGGMDCSGTIYHLLRSRGFSTVPRQSDQIAQWVILGGDWTRTEKVYDLKAPEFEKLRPGDLLFWSGTYEHTERKMPVSHVMIYLGTHRKTGKPVIFGASDGRTYDGKRRCGVSVFDFPLPQADAKTQFFGYGSPPGLHPARKPTPPAPAP